MPKFSLKGGGGVYKPKKKRLKGYRRRKADRQPNSRMRTYINL